ncbi:MAG: hypothetical protein A2252_00605 [Elusimicrobia bacterium RIFOXYA2_FULL_39_19]|nr:MAG: hypothetical protein A2252_00605 [Elusimicrobia bacterium RIFOXYA2_FULL_39_19]
MKKYIFCALLVLNTSAFVQAQDPAGTSARKFQWRKVTNDAFALGEKLEFQISWGLLEAGQASMKIENIETVNGRQAYHLVTESKSLPFFDVFYKVRNKDESWIDVESVCSLKYEKHQHEGSYIREEITTFDQIAGRFDLNEHVQGKDSVKKEGDIPEFTQDVLSALYFLRTLELEPGKEYYINAQSGDKSYPLKIVVYKKEKVHVPAGNFECFKLEPFLVGDSGLFRAKGRLWIWMTTDKRRIPVLMRSKIFVGSISAELKKIN